MDIYTHQEMSSFTITTSALKGQWSNPGDVSALLMIIGGDVVQKALAQGTGNWFTPVCFSFGWVSYAFVSLVNILGDGRLLPPPDYPVKVFNLGSGYCRENKNWVVGRIMRDLEAWSDAKVPPRSNSGIRISIFKAIGKDTGPTQFRYAKIHLFGAICIVVQLALAVLPIALGGEWGILLITGAGTLLAQLTGSLPQWAAEKLPSRQNERDVFALTQGNGSRDVMVIFGDGKCLDLEEMAAPSNPRGARPWEKFAIKSSHNDPKAKHPEGQRAPPELRRQRFWESSRKFHGLPNGFWVTLIFLCVSSVLWLLLLINVAAPRDYNWVLLGIGTLGMFQNGIVAAMSREPKSRNLPLRWIETIETLKGMDGIMDFEYSCSRKANDKSGEPLLKEFFPGRLRPAEDEWWKGEYNEYDSERLNDPERGKPRRLYPDFPQSIKIPAGQRDDDCVTERERNLSLISEGASEMDKAPQSASTWPRKSSSTLPWLLERGKSRTEPPISPI